MAEIYNQWSTIKPYFGGAAAWGANSWIPEDDRDRINAYIKYDQIYWNDSKQYALRVLEGEQPLYIPNARIIVDTTAYYYLKGLNVSCSNKDTDSILQDFLKRELFYSRFDEAKTAGVARGDFVMHMTANPQKAAGTKISLNSVDPSSVFPIWDEDQPDCMIGCHIAIQYIKPDDPKNYVRALTYRLVPQTDGTNRVSRQETIYSLDENWWGSKAIVEQVILPLGMLDSRIDHIPIYWFKNRGWDGEDFGSSELRGFESLGETISQGATDVSAALALEGLGVYATDGGRPVTDDGTETDWEVAPGKVMEVPTGSYFRRVEGVGSITPAVEQISYLEDKIYKATGLNDTALGSVNAQIAASGVALAISFLPTLAKMETRDKHGIDLLTQLFYNWKTWFAVFEKQPLDGDIIPVIGDKLPTDRVAKLNELNNMFDRKVISAAYYREEMTKLGYVFPSDAAMQAEIVSEVEAVTAAAAPPAPPVAEEEDPPTNDGNTLPDENQSNNANRPNESSGTEAVNKTRDA